MTAQPVHREPSGQDDPAVIYGNLPARHRREFLRQYTAAAQKAARDLDSYKELVALLSLWRLRVAAYGRQGYDERRLAARTPRPDDVPIENLIPEWPTRSTR